MNLCYTDSNGTNQLNRFKIFKTLINLENQFSSIDLDRVVFDDKIFNEANEPLIQELLKHFIGPFIGVLTNRCSIFKNILSSIDKFQLHFKNGIQTHNINLPEFKLNSRNNELIFTMKKATINEPIPIMLLLNTYKFGLENISNFFNHRFKFFINLSDISMFFYINNSKNFVLSFKISSDSCSLEYGPSKRLSKCITKLTVDVIEKQQEIKRFLINKASVYVNVNSVDAEFKINYAVNSTLNLSFNLIFPLFSVIRFNSAKSCYFPGIICYCLVNDILSFVFEMNKCIICINSLKNVTINCERLCLVNSNFKTLNEIKNLTSFKFEFKSLETFIFYFPDTFIDCLLLKFKNLGIDYETIFDNKQNQWREDFEVSYGCENSKKVKNADKLSFLTQIKQFPGQLRFKFDIEAWSNLLTDQIKKINSADPKLIVSLLNARFKLSFISKAESNKVKWHFKLINVTNQNRQFFLINQSVFKRVYIDFIDNQSNSFINEICSNYSKLAMDHDLNEKKTNLCLFANLNGNSISEIDLKYVDMSMLVCIAHRSLLLAISDFFRLINHVKI